MTNMDMTIINILIAHQHAVEIRPVLAAAIRHAVLAVTPAAAKSISAEPAL
jgi:hypothetical protein